MQRQAVGEEPHVHYSLGYTAFAMTLTQAFCQAAHPDVSDGFKSSKNQPSDTECP